MNSTDKLRNIVADAVRKYVQETGIYPQSLEIDYYIPELGKHDLVVRKIEIVIGK